MTRLLSALKRFFFPPITSSPVRLLMPYATLGVVAILVFVSGSYAWDYTNSPPFCGSTCHTMPPEYTAYQVSPHARVQCVECHIGRGFFGTQFLDDLRTYLHTNIIGLPCVDVDDPDLASESLRQLAGHVDDIDRQIREINGNQDILHRFLFLQGVNYKYN